MIILNKKSKKSIGGGDHRLAEMLAKTKNRIAITTLFHVWFSILSVYGIHFMSYVLSSGDDLQPLKPYATFFGVILIVFVGVYMPFIYLFAMYRLLKHIEERENKDLGN